MPGPSASPEQAPGLHRIRPGAADLVGGPVEVTAYAWGGKEVPPDGPLALAKECLDPATGRRSHWLKRATVGRESGMLYNPQSPNFDARAAGAAHGPSGRDRYEYRRATPEAFALYLRFLATGNPTNLRNAERC